MSDLVARLSHGDHPVEVSLRPERTATLLKESVDRGYVHVRFTDTRGGTELGLAVDPRLTDLTAADFERGSGRVTIGGALTLDFEPVRCIVEIDLSSLEGRGHLERITDDPGTMA